MQTTYTKGENTSFVYSRTNKENKLYYYPELGNNGRFGNQMFQYAAVFSLAKANDTEAVVPEPKESSDRNYNHIHLYDAFPNLTATKMLKDEMDPKYSYVSKEGVDFNFEPGLMVAKDGCSINGYFQSEMYFDRFSNDIRKEFSFRPDIIEYSKKEYLRLKSESGGANICAIHFRRGDYTKLGHVHTNLGSEYYNQAISWMVSNIEGCKFVAFSDDIAWCKKNLPQGFLFAETPSMFHDMSLMSMCDSHIIANSSFSWWGAWLSKSSKQVIAPKNWFGPEGPKAWSTIYCKGWGII